MEGKLVQGETMTWIRDEHISEIHHVMIKYLTSTELKRTINSFFKKIPKTK